MQDDRELAEALCRALEPAPHEPSRERIAALQRQVRRQRLRQPFRRAAVAAVAAALLAVLGAGLAVSFDNQSHESAADAVAISNTREAINEVRYAIAAGNPAQIKQATTALESQLVHLEPSEQAAVKAALGSDANVVIAQAHRVLDSPPPSRSTVPSTASPSTSTTTTSSSTTTSTSTSTTTTTSTPATVPATDTTVP